eukprot:1138542-Pyramimonas_sp.AAC.1
MPALGGPTTSLGCSPCLRRYSSACAAMTLCFGRRCCWHTYASTLRPHDHGVPRRHQRLDKHSKLLATTSSYKRGWH